MTGRTIGHAHGVCASPLGHRVISGKRRLRGRALHWHIEKGQKSHDQDSGRDEEKAKETVHDAPSDQRTRIWQVILADRVGCPIGKRTHHSGRVILNVLRKSRSPHHENIVLPPCLQIAVQG